MAMVWSRTHGMRKLVLRIAGESNLQVPVAASSKPQHIKPNRLRTLSRETFPASQSLSTCSNLSLRVEPIDPSSNVTACESEIQVGPPRILHPGRRDTCDVAHECEESWYGRVCASRPARGRGNFPWNLVQRAPELGHIEGFFGLLTWVPFVQKLFGYQYASKRRRFKKAMFWRSAGFVSCLNASASPVRTRLYCICEFGPTGFTASEYISLVARSLHSSFVWRIAQVGQRGQTN